MTITPPPSPEAATDEAAFMAGLRRLKDWSGLSFRQLERRASAAGDVLPYSTASTMLGRDRLPREELLVAFVRACGLGGVDVLRWGSVRAEVLAVAGARGGGAGRGVHRPARVRGGLRVDLRGNGRSHPVSAYESDGVVSGARRAKAGARSGRGPTPMRYAGPYESAGKRRMS